MLIEAYWVFISPLGSADDDVMLSGCRLRETRS